MRVQVLQADLSNEEEEYIYITNNYPALSPTLKTENKDPEQSSAISGNNMPASEDRFSENLNVEEQISN